MEYPSITRPVTICGVLVLPGTPAQVSPVKPSGLTTVTVPGIGSRDFLTPPV